MFLKAFFAFVYTELVDGREVKLGVIIYLVSKAVINSANSLLVALFMKLIKICASYSFPMLRWSCLEI